MRLVTVFITLLVTSTAASAQNNMATWPLPATLSPEGRAMAEAMAKQPMPNPMPPVALQRQIIGGMQETMGGQLAKRCCQSNANSSPHDAARSLKAAD
jgi:hypothetical protein